MHGDWGRCKRDDGHEGAHKFPTEEDYDAMECALAATDRAATTRAR